MKTTRHSLMAKGLLVLLTLLILIFVFTYSWFVDVQKPITATGFSASVETNSTDFHYAVGFANSQTGNDYRHTAFTNAENANLNLEALYDSDGNGPYNLLYDYNAVDVTGDGVTLVRPSMEYGNWSVNKASRNYSVAEENKQYVSFDLIFKSTSQHTTIRLDSGSYAKGDCEDHSGDGNLKGAASGNDGSTFNYNDLVDKTNNNSNKYGRFSRDAIVGAVRVAFLSYEDNDQPGLEVLDNETFKTYDPEPVLLWVPRPDIYLNNNGSDGETHGWTLEDDVLPTDFFNLQSKAMNDSSYTTYRHQYYNIFEVGSGETPAVVTYPYAVCSELNTSAGNNDNKVTLGDSFDILPLTHLDDANNNGQYDQGEYYYGKIRVRIWLEGTDTEARRALAGGKFSVSFHING